VPKIPQTAEEAREQILNTPRSERSRAFEGRRYWVQIRDDLFEVWMDDPGVSPMMVSSESSLDVAIRTASDYSGRALILPLLTLP
jgi:hypothetical protein